DVVHAVLRDEPIDGGDPFGDHVFMIVGDDLELVLLAADFQSALSVDLVEDELGRLLVGNAPRRGRTGERCRDPELDDVSREGAPRPDGDERRHYEKRCPDHETTWFHRHPSWTRCWGRGPRAPRTIETRVTSCQWGKAVRVNCVLPQDRGRPAAPSSPSDRRTARS